MKDITRRNFLKGTAGAVVVTVTGTLLPKEAQTKLIEEAGGDESLNEIRLRCGEETHFGVTPNSRIRWTLYEHPTRKTYSLSGDILVWRMDKDDGEISFKLNTHLNATQEINSKDDELLLQFAQRAIREAFEDHADRRMWGELEVNALQGRTCIRQWHE